MPKKGNVTNEIHTLQQLGLNENESFLYAFLLEHPNSTVQQLQVKTPLPRTVLYHVLNRLIETNLVVGSKNGWRTIYSAQSPDHLYDLLHEKERQFTKTQQSVRKLVPKLKNKHRLAGQRLSVRTFEGVDEYKKALDDIILSKPRLILAYENLCDENRSGVEMRESHERSRITKKIMKNVLTTDSPQSRSFIKNRAYDDYTQLRLNPSTHSDLDVDLLLYGNKLMYTNYQDREPVTIIVEDPGLHKMKSFLFESLWEQATDVTLSSYEN